VHASAWTSLQAEGRRLAEALDDAETRDREHCADHEVARAALQEAIAALEGDVAAEQHAHAAAVAAAGEHLASVEAQHLGECRASLALRRITNTFTWTVLERSVVRRQFTFASAAHTPLSARGVSGARLL
jgi:hypothetical protein